MEQFDPSSIVTTASIYTGDQGKGKLRFGSKLVIRTKPANDIKSYPTIYPLADIKCKKDNGAIFKLTVKDNLAKGINRIEHGKVMFDSKEVEGQQKWYCTIVDPGSACYRPADPSVIDVVAFVIGDLKFLSMMLGKENFDTGHCFQCQLYIDQWQHKIHNRGECWTINKINEQARMSDKLTGIARKGVREEAYFDVPVERYIWPILHILIGVGNAILDYLIDVIENEIQLIPLKELLMRRELGELEAKHKELQTVRDYFDSNHEDFGLTMIKQHKQQNRECENIMDKLEDEGRSESDEYATVWNTSKLCIAEMKVLERERKGLTTKVENARKAVALKKETLLGCRRTRKTEEMSLYTGVDQILQKYNIVRAAYHGGDLNGGGIKILMGESNNIMSDVEQYPNDDIKFSV